MQDLDGATNLVVATDDRVELARRGARSEVHGVLLERLAAAFRIRVVDLFAAAHFLDGLLDRAFDDTGILEQLRQVAIFESRQHEQLAGNELVATLLSKLVGDVEQLVQLV